MKNIMSVYDEYRILPQLRLHQLRVAAVSKILCDNTTVSVDAEYVVRAALLHDMGNIIKFDLGVFPEFLEPEGRAYWEEVKKEYIETYGTDEHEASLRIVKDVTGSERIVEIVETVDFGHIEERLATEDFGIKIIGYADNRVYPQGVVSLAKRQEDGEKRYGAAPGGYRERYYASMERIETEIAQHSHIDPKSIDDEMIAPVIEELKTWQV